MNISTTVTINATSRSESFGDVDVGVDSSDSWASWTGPPPVHARPITVQPVADDSGSSVNVAKIPAIPATTANPSTTRAMIPRTSAVPIGECGSFVPNLLSTRGFLGGALSGIGFSLIIALIVIIFVCCRRRRQRKSSITRMVMSDINSPCLLNFQISESNQADVNINFSDNNDYGDPNDVTFKAADTKIEVDEDSTYEELNKHTMSPFLLNETTSKVVDTKIEVDDDNTYEEPIKQTMAPSLLNDATSKVVDTKIETDADNAYEEPIKVISKHPDQEEVCGSGDTELCFSDGQQFVRMREEDSEVDYDHHNDSHHYEFEKKVDHTYAAVGGAGLLEGGENVEEIKYQNVKRQHAGGYRGGRPNSMSVRQTTV